ncbi:MAG: hypothetical protein D6698_15275 [Gammaproteobacteria bacterium]|nr:MAG: hypothetical protein D6698_15275 [Gammaproteobacteria bacterium]
MRINLLTSAALSVLLTLLVFASVYAFSGEESETYPTFVDRTDLQTYEFTGFKSYSLDFLINANFSMNVLVETTLNERGSSILENQTITGNFTSYDLRYRFETAGSVMISVRPVVAEDQNFTIGFAGIRSSVTPDDQYIISLYSLPALVTAGVVLLSLVLPAVGSRLLYFTYNPERFLVITFTSPLLAVLGSHLIPFALPVRKDEVLFSFLLDSLLFPSVLWLVPVLLVLSYFSRQVSRVQQLWSIPRGKQLTFVSRFLSLLLDLALSPFIFSFLVARYYLTPLLDISPDILEYSLALWLSNLSVLLLWSLVLTCLSFQVDSVMTMFSGAVVAVLLIQFGQSLLPKLSSSPSSWSTLTAVLSLPLLVVAFKLYLFSEVSS